ncbi:MBL fold metallo-hydrolase [bacterium]|nr:MBL fold metallo-hydrolase [bacterium]
MEVKHFFDQDTFTLTYVVWDEATKDGVIIDSLMNYDPATSTYTHKSIDEATEFIKEKGINLHYIIDSHPHADHLTGSQELKKRFPNAKTVIGNGVTTVQKAFKEFFNLEKNFAVDGSQFDKLIEDNEVLKAGSLEIKALHAPGHTPACYALLIEDAVFTGDILFMPDFGTGRCDFPKGDAEALYDSIQNKLYTLPDETRLFTGHDYQPGGRELMFESTIGEAKKNNVQIKADTTKEDFVKFRTERDAVLNAPRLLLPSIEVNINAGNLPEADDNGVSYLKIPIRPKS